MPSIKQYYRKAEKNAQMADRIMTRMEKNPLLKYELKGLYGTVPEVLHSEASSGDDSCRATPSWQADFARWRVWQRRWSVAADSPCPPPAHVTSERSPPPHVTRDVL